jgi:hypothetical protein
MQRLKDMPAEKIVAFAGLFSFVFLAVWVGGIAAVWLVFGLGDVQVDFWGAVEGLSAAATLATVVGGGLFALAQLVESVEGRELELEGRNLDIYNQAFERLMSDANIEARRWIYIHLDPDPEKGLGSLSAEGQQHVKLVLNSFDHLGFLIKQDWITGDAVIEWVSPFVVKVWEKIGPYVEYEAARRNEPDYYEAAKYLAEKCREWRTERFPDAQVTWVEKGL